MADDGDGLTNLFLIVLLAALAILALYYECILLNPPDFIARILTRINKNWSCAVRSSASPQPTKPYVPSPPSTTPYIPPTTQPYVPASTKPYIPPSTQPYAPPSTRPYSPPSTQPYAPPSTQPYVGTCVDASGKPMTVDNFKKEESTLKERNDWCSSHNLGGLTQCCPDVCCYSNEWNYCMSHLDPGQGC